MLVPTGSSIHGLMLSKCTLAGGVNNVAAAIREGGNPCVYVVVLMKLTMVFRGPRRDVECIPVKSKM